MSRGSPSPVRVCIVAENCLVTAYLCDVLRSDPGLQRFSTETLQRCGMPPHANVVYVVEARGLSSPLGQCLHQLRKFSKTCRFLVLDEWCSTDETVRLLHLGAHGFLAHAEVSAKLTRAVRFVANGHFWVPPGAFERYLTQVRMGLNDNRHVTPREDEILDLLRMRLSNKEIAEFLRIRVSTVKFHVTHILSKLHVSSRRDLFANGLRTILDRLPS